MENYRTIGCGQSSNFFGNRQDGQLLGTADIDRQVVILFQKQVQAAYEVIDIKQAARLLSGTISRHRLPAQRLRDKIRNYASVVGAHPRAISIEDAHDAGV